MKVKTDIIFTADLHLTDSQPPCRTDNYWAAQEQKLTWLSNLCNDSGAALVVAGDLFDEAAPSYRVLNLAMQWLTSFRNPVVMIAGQHDLPYHRADANRCAFGALSWLNSRDEEIVVVMQATPCVTAQYNLSLFPYGTEIGEPLGGSAGIPYIAVVHRMTCHGPEDAALADHAGGTSAMALITAHPQYDLIVTGDNHRPFSIWHTKTKLINCGSLMRRRADQANHRPMVWAWQAKDNEINQIAVPIAPGVVSREHIDVPAERDERLAAFVRRLDGASAVDLGEGFAEQVAALVRKVPISFRETLGHYLKAVLEGEEPDYADVQ